MSRTGVLGTGVLETGVLDLPGGGTFKSLAGGGGSHMATSSTILRNTGDNKNRGRMSFCIVLMGSKHASSNTSGPYK